MQTEIIKLKKFSTIAHVRLVYFVVSIALSLGSAAFEGLSIGLLVPMAKGVIVMDFSFVKDLPVFKSVIQAFPDTFINTTNPNSSIFLLLLVTIFTAVVVKNVLSYFACLAMERQKKLVSIGVRDAIFSRYLSFGKLFFDRTNLGRLGIVIFNFVDNSMNLLSAIRRSLTDFSTLACYLAIMCMISWKLTLFSLIILPVLYYSVSWITEKMKRTSKDHARSHIATFWRTFDVFACISLIKACSMEKNEKKRFNKLNAATEELSYSLEKKRLIIAPIQEIALTVVLLLIISAMALLFVKGHKTAISGFLVFFYILRKSAPLFGTLSNLKMDFARAEGPTDAILEVFEDRDKFIIPEGDNCLKGLKKKIELKNLKFSYLKEVPIIKDMSFTVEKGKLTALVGPTGTGKTTLIGLLLRFYDCPPETIFVDGIDIRSFTLKSLMENMAVVSQGTILFNDTIMNNITYGANEVSCEKVVEIVKKAKLYDFIMSLPNKFETLVGDRGVKLSGGEKQRLSIARALLKGAEILMLDEATSSLDTRTERFIQEAIDEAIKGKTAIVIAHRLSTIKHADKIVVIENGKLIEEGALQELLDRKGRFYQYWEEQKFY